MNILCTICMRGGSKGVPNKNIRQMNGKPLLYYTLNNAHKAKFFDHIVVSTDSQKIANKSKQFGAEAWFLRPKEFATDESDKIEARIHALLESENHYSKKFDVIIDLDVTSPLRTSDDIINAYKQFINEDSDNLISVSESRKNPYFNMVEFKNGKVSLVKNKSKNISRRQDAPKVYDMNASIYIWKRQVLLGRKPLFNKNTSLYIMPLERSIDIDSEFEWDLVKYLQSKK